MLPTVTCTHLSLPAQFRYVPPSCTPISEGHIAHFGHVINPRGSVRPCQDDALSADLVSSPAKYLTEGCSSPVICDSWSRILCHGGVPCNPKESQTNSCQIALHQMLMYELLASVADLATINLVWE